MAGTGHPAEAPRFEPNWESLKQYNVPDWFRDAKLGIFLHWGVQSVAANDGWYARHMYVQEGAPWGRAYEHHLKHYNFDNYASTWQPWNSVNMGPHKDVVGEWKRAAEGQGLRFGVSSHCDRTWDWFLPSHASDVRGPLKGVPYDGNLARADGTGTWWEGYDPEDLYCRPHRENEPHDPAYLEKWYRRTRELIDEYQPDLLYFDGPLPLGEYGLRIAAHFYNANMEWHSGRLEAVINVKSWGAGTVPDESVIVLDIEKGQSGSLRTFPWQTDTSLLESWFYSPDPLVLSDAVVVHNLCDIVSKNGNLLLNVGLRSDGTLPEDQEQTLRSVGEWLALNGEAIYGTRPWEVYGEGPTPVEDGDFRENKTPFTAQDIRFTTKGNTLYAIILGWPENNRISIRALARGRKLWFGSIEKVTLIGADAELTWTLSDSGLAVELPGVRKPCDHAYVLRITGANSKSLAGASTG